MNILNIQLPKNHFHTLLHLAQNKEHNVYSNWHGSTSYENACGIHTLTSEDNDYIKGKPEDVIGYIEKFIGYYNIDILQVADQSVRLTFQLHACFFEKRLDYSFLRRLYKQTIME